MLDFLISGKAIANTLCMSESFRDDSKEEWVSQVGLRTVLFFLRAPASDVTGSSLKCKLDLRRQKAVVKKGKNMLVEG